MVHEVRQEYLGVCASLEPGFDPGCVHWPRNDVLCSPVWANAANTVLTQKHNNTNLLQPPTAQHQLHTTEDTHPCPSTCPNHVAHSTEEAVSAEHGPTSPVLSTTEHKELRDGSVPSPPGNKDIEGSEAAPVSLLPVVGGNVEPEMRSPLGGLQTSTLGSVSELSVSSSQLSLSSEEEEDGEVEHDGCTNRQGTANKFKQEEKEGSGEVPDQLTGTSEQYPLRSVTLESTPPETRAVNEGPTGEVEEDEVHKEVREGGGSNFAVPNAPEELFFREISAIIASAEQEGRSYEELKGQLELELAWVKQAIHSRQQASLLYCIVVRGWGCGVCVRACVCVQCVVCVRCVFCVVYYVYIYVFSVCASVYICCIYNYIPYGWKFWRKDILADC